MSSVLLSPLFLFLTHSLTVMWAARVHVAGIGAANTLFFPLTAAVATGNERHSLVLLRSSARTNEQNDEHVNDYFALAAAAASS